MLSKSASNRFSFNLNPDWELTGLASAGQKSGAPVQQQPTRISQLHNTASLASLGTRCGQWLKFRPLFYLLALTFISSVLAGKDAKPPSGIALLLPTTPSILNKAFWPMAIDHAFRELVTHSQSKRESETCWSNTTSSLGTYETWLQKIDTLPH